MQIGLSSSVPFFQPALSAPTTGISKLGYDPGQAFLQRSSNLSLALLPKISYVANFVNIINAYARLKYHPGPEWLEVYVQESFPYLDDYGPRELASTLNSFANLRFIAPRPYMEKIRDRLLASVNEMGPIELNGAVNGFAKAARPEQAQYADRAFHPGEEVLQRLSTASYQRLEHFGPQGLAGLINGFTTHLDFDPGKLML